MWANHTRREFIGASVAGGLAGAVPTAAFARQVSGAPLLLVDRSLDVAGKYVSGLPAADHVDLEADLVQQWRGALSSQIAAGRETIAVTRWAQAIVLTGLARESGATAHRKALGSQAFETRLVFEQVSL